MEPGEVESEGDAHKGEKLLTHLGALWWMHCRASLPSTRRRGKPLTTWASPYLGDTVEDTADDLQGSLQ